MIHLRGSIDRTRNRSRLSNRPFGERRAADHISFCQKVASCGVALPIRRGRKVAEKISRERAASFVFAVVFGNRRVAASKRRDWEETF